MTRAPLRISFAGGGTDIEPYCLEYGGCVLSVAIKKYVYATLDKGKSEVEQVITHHFKSDGVKIENEAPPMSGLGGSASCFVAGIKALDPSMKKRHIAELAFHLERNVMNITGGKQDQYMAAYGGLNFLEFTDKVKIKQLPIPKGFEDLFLLVYMGKRKNAGCDIIKDQMARNNIKAFAKQKSLAQQMVSCIQRDGFLEFGSLLDEAWHSKMEFSPLIANDNIKDFYYMCLRWGAIGGKLTGAGGGGYMLLMEHPDKRNELRLKLWAKGVKHERVEFEGSGVCVK